MSHGAQSHSPRRPRRVMQVTWSSVASGAEIYALTIAARLDKTRFTPLLCALDQGGALEAGIARLGLADRVLLLGVRRDVPRLLAAADVFVLASDREGLPIAVLEAMAAARPVVATAVGNLPDVIRDGATGRLVPPGDCAALAAALAELLGDPQRAAGMGEAAREAARAYDVRAMIERYDRAV